MKKIVVTGAAGQIAYQLIFRIASGDLFNEPFALSLLEIPELADSLEGIKMELEDCAFPLVQSIEYGSDPYEGFKGATHVFLVGAKPRSPGMERVQLLSENGKIFVAQGQALNETADRNVKVLVVGNPCNTNCLIALQKAPDLNKRNFFAMTRLDQNRASFQLAAKAGVRVDKVTRLTIWGNHSTTQMPDFFNAQINGKPVLDVIQDRQWLEGPFIEGVQKRGALVLAKRGKSSAASAANAALDSMRDITQVTPQGNWYSAGVFSEGNPYGIDPTLIYSFPCRTNAEGKVEIVSGLDLNPFLKKGLEKSENELKEERGVIG